MSIARIALFYHQRKLQCSNFQSQHKHINIYNYIQMSPLHSFYHKLFSFQSILYIWHAENKHSTPPPHELVTHLMERYYKYFTITILLCLYTHVNIIYWKVLRTHYTNKHVCCFRCLTLICLSIFIEISLLQFSSFLFSPFHAWHGTRKIAITCVTTKCEQRALHILTRSVQILCQREGFFSVALFWIGNIWNGECEKEHTHIYIIYIEMMCAL